MKFKNIFTLIVISPFIVLYILMNYVMFFKIDFTKKMSGIIFLNVFFLAILLSLFFVVRKHLIFNSIDDLKPKKREFKKIKELLIKHNKTDDSNKESVIEEIINEFNKNSSIYVIFNQAFFVDRVFKKNDVEYFPVFTSRKEIVLPDNEHFDVVSYVGVFQDYKLEHHDTKGVLINPFSDSVVLTNDDLKKIQDKRYEEWKKSHKK